MASTEGAIIAMGTARKRADDEHARAARAARVAAGHERLAKVGSVALRSVHEDMARLHRDLEQRHRVAASLHAKHAERLLRWAAAGVERRVTQPPQFIVAVAEALHARAVGLTLLGSDRTEKTVIASHPVATAAHDLEFVVGEGPAHDAAAKRELVVATAAAFPDRWAHYSPAAVRLGVRSVDAMPMYVHDTCLGVLTVFDPPDLGVEGRAQELGTIADALVHAELLDSDGAEQNATSLLGDGDHRAVVHQAAGMIIEQLDCGVADALALLRARAFVGDEPLAAVAQRVLSRQLTFN